MTHADRNLARSAIATALALLAQPAWAGAGDKPSVNATAIVLFLAFVLLTLYITWKAAQRTKSTNDFYAAGGSITGFQNGLAIAGDAMSAGAFLGLTGLVFSSGFDGLIYAVGYTTGMPIVVFLLAERIRRLGRYTFTDVVCTRLSEVPIRVFAACASLVVVALYLIAQMVGAGQLIELLFGLDYLYAEFIVGILMICYVMFGGMVATTWVQIVKAALLMAGATVISVLVMADFGFDFGNLLSHASAVRPEGSAILSPHASAKSPFSALSLGLALMLGTAGLPHILMRFFTVPDVKAARISVFWAATFMNYFYALVFVLGFGAMVLTAGKPAYHDATGALRGGSNMAAIHLSHAVGGDAMMGFISAVAFATILAVVSGLTLAGATAVSHDLFAGVLRRGRIDEQAEVRISRIATLVLGLLAIGLGIAFKGQNVAYMVSLAFAVACSSTFPVLLLSLYWRGLTTAGAVAGGSVGLLSALGLTVLGPAVWVKVLGHAAPIVAMDPPTLISLPLAFATCWLVSKLDSSKLAESDKSRFDEQQQMGA